MARILKVNKPGQLMTYRGLLYRAQHAKYGCLGCALNGPFECPNIKYANASQDREVYCHQNLINFKKVDEKRQS